MIETSIGCLPHWESSLQPGRCLDQPALLGAESTPNHWALRPTKGAVSQLPRPQCRVGCKNRSPGQRFWGVWLPSPGDPRTEGELRGVLPLDCRVQCCAGLCPTEPSPEVGPGLPSGSLPGDVMSCWGKSSAPHPVFQIILTARLWRNTFEAVLMFDAVGRREASELGRRGQMRCLAVRLKSLKESPLRR